MNQWATWEVDRQLEAAAKALEANEFRVTITKDRAEAADFIETEAVGSHTVGFGGSVTLAELGFPGRLAEKGYECLAHGAPGLSPEERAQIMRRQLTCDLFLTGINAVTLDGKLVNIDANGNRVGALTFGPHKVIAVAGVNKISENVESALKRVRSWASPPTRTAWGGRLRAPRPAFAPTAGARTGSAASCTSWKGAPPLNDLRVVLIAESLGL